MTQAWIFQAVPEDFDLPGALIDLSEMTWGIRQEHCLNRIQPGDTVFLWEAGKEAGILAIAKVRTEPAPLRIFEQERPYIRRGNRIDDVANRVWLDIEQVFPERIRKKRLREHPKLRELSILRNPRGTNFKVTPEQRQLLQTLISKQIKAVAAYVERSFDPSDATDARDKRLTAISIRGGQPAFRQALLSAYQARCAVTGCDVPRVLEAAHIYPYQGEQTNHVSNGLLLRADLHLLFDFRLISIDTKTKGYRVVVKRELKGTSYGGLSGRRLRLPQDPTVRPSKKALDWHRRKAGL